MLDALSTDMVHAVSDPSSPGRCAALDLRAGGQDGAWRAESSQCSLGGRLGGHGRARSGADASPSMRSSPVCGGGLLSRFSCNAIRSSREDVAGVGPGRDPGSLLQTEWCFRASDWIL